MSSKCFYPAILYWIPNAYVFVLATTGEVPAITRDSERKHGIGVALKIETSLFFTLAFQVGVSFAKRRNSGASMKVPFDNGALLASSEQPLEIF